MSEGDPMTDKPDGKRFIAWGAVVGAVLATVAAISISFGRATDPLWKNQLNENELRALGRWIFVPACAGAGAFSGLLISRRLARRK
jgi:hypothetical protein